MDVFLELLSEGNGFVPGGLPSACQYLGREGFMAVSGRTGRDARQQNFIGEMTLCAAVIATLLVTGGVELNPGPVNNIVQVSCSGCDKNLKSGTQCDTCGRWYHNSCGNVKFQVAESGKLNCERWRSERMQVLEEKLRDAQFQIDKLKRRNKELKDQL
jgi:hypothetical protein